MIAQSRDFNGQVLSNWPTDLGPSHLVVIQEEFTGHRLAYVAAIAEEAISRGLDVVLVTKPEATTSREFAVHVAALVQQSGLTIAPRPNLTSHKELVRLFRTIRRKGASVVMPDSDRHLPAVLAAKLLLSLPRRTTLLLMRPPRRVLPGLGGVMRPLFKTANIIGLLPFGRSIDIAVLEDPIACHDDRAWKGRVLGTAARRAFDPCDLMASENPELPAEIPELPNSVVGVIGAIDARKRLPTIMEAWNTRFAREDVALLLAGRWSDAAREQATHLSFDHRVHIVDRYLSDSELLACLLACKAVFVLHDQGMSSGVLTAAAMHGRYVIALSGSRTGRSALAAGVGVVCDERPSSMAAALDFVLSHDHPAPHDVLPTRRDFARRILKQHT